MDRIDQRLLSSLQEDSRRSIAELAEQVALSPSACHRRIKQLEDSGFIQGYGARVDGKKLGYAMEFFIGVSLETQHEDRCTQGNQESRVSRWIDTRERVRGYLSGARGDG